MPGPGGELLTNKTPCTAKFDRQIKEATHFVAMAIQTDGDRVISAPLWFKQ